MCVAPGQEGRDFSARNIGVFLSRWIDFILGMTSTATLALAHGCDALHMNSSREK